MQCRCPTCLARARGMVDGSAGFEAHITGKAIPGDVECPTTGCGHMLTYREKRCRNCKVLNTAKFVPGGLDAIPDLPRSDFEA